eukprot:CAMPEP_0174240256 /NCGR_PEP_ID=MMETSP0417-20130205/18119_1 /TAXON_ID=242541 /ORGANISM="Mayorella sp, Strain BSH-02190019" /LENGTH=365 /DNA_ID=CAMNT_0015319311 /DNA_START=97 /DNA_END=1191 /DNA_ORIENTATION=+
MAAHSSEHPTASGLEEEPAAAALYPNVFGIPLREGEQPFAVCIGMGAYSSSYPNGSTGREEDPTAPYPNAFGIPLVEGEKPRANVAVAHRLPAPSTASVCFHRFRESSSGVEAEDGGSRGVNLHVLWKLSPETLKRAHRLVYRVFGSQRIDEDGNLKAIPPEERIAPPSCFLASNPCARTEFDTSTAAVELSWKHDIKLGAGQVHCVEVSDVQGTADSERLLNSISTCGNDQDDDDTSPSVWQACPCSSAEWLPDDDPDIDEDYPDHDAGPCFQIALDWLEKVISLTENPNVAFEVALCYCLLLENSVLYNRIETPYPVVAEYDGLVADLLRCEPAAVRLQEKRLEYFRDLHRIDQMSMFEALEW